MVYDADRLDLPYGKQRGEEIHALLDMLEKNIEKQLGNISLSGNVSKSVEGAEQD
jgi:glutamate racemase